MVFAIGVLHRCQSSLVLCTRIELQIVITQQLKIRRKAVIGTALSRHFGAPCEGWTKERLSKVTRMIQHYVKNDLDSLSMCRVNKLLKVHVFSRSIGYSALIATVNTFKTHRMIAVIVISRGVFHNGSNPD